MKAFTVFGVLSRLRDIYSAELETAIEGRMRAEKALERDTPTTLPESLATAKLAALRVVQDEIQRLHASGYNYPSPFPPSEAGCANCNPAPAPAGKEGA